MAINKKFIHFKRKATFQRELDAGNILNTSMVFISDSKQFYVNGQFFSENTLFDLNQLLENVSGELSETDTTNEAVIKLYKLIQEVNEDVNNIIKLLISEIDNLRETTNERIDKTDKIVASGLSQHNNDIDKLKTTTEELKSSTDSLSVKVEDHLDNKDLQHIPEGGHDKQILVWKSNGTAEWKDLATMFTGLEDILAYGVEWNINVADPHLTRIGNMSLHKTLPIQSQLKGCIAQKDKVIYWLNESDWRFKKDPETVSIGLTVDRGYSLVSDIFSTLRYKEQWVKIGGVACQIGSINTDTNTAYLVANDQLDALGLVTGTQDVELGAVLNGYDGTVRVYCPDFYIKSQVIGDIRRVWLSTVKIDDTWTYQHEILVDAYRCTVLNTVPKNMGYLSTLPVNSAISVVNTATYCRGGDNREAFDKYATGDGAGIDIFRSDLCKPRTNQPRSTFRTECRNAGSEMLSYNQYKNIFYWLYVVEYANFNCQETYNATLTDNGYHQGGMGVGVTTIKETDYSNYNRSCPLTPCGYLNEIGNGTGIKAMTLPAATTSTGTAIPTITFQVPRWRGFDNPFGDTWTNLDGIIIKKDAANQPLKVFVTDNPAKYGDDATAMANMEVAGIEVSQIGYIKLFDLGETAEIIPSKVGDGANTTKYKCDYHICDATSTERRSLFVGGGALDGATAGLGYFHSFTSVADSVTVIGFRSVSSFVSLSEIED